MTLKDRVEQVFPEWQRWYPSLFDAAVDLGILRARVCDPSSLLLRGERARGMSAIGAPATQRRGGISANCGTSPVMSNHGALEST